MRELTNKERIAGLTLCYARDHRPDADLLAADAPCPICRSDIVRIVDAPQDAPRPETAVAWGEPWAVYCPSSNHVQRCYAKREDAEAYRDDINAASRIKDWIVVDARVILSDVNELNRATPPAAPGPVVTAEDDIALGVWIASQIERCEEEIARTDSNKYVPEDEDDEEGAVARDDLAAFRRIRALLKL